MEKPNSITDNQVRVWNNALAVSYYVLIVSVFGILFLEAFIQNKDKYGSLITGIFFLCLAYEMTVNSYIRVTYLNGNLEFCKPLRKYSLFFRKRNHRIEIRPDEWTEVYCRGYKGGTSYYFRNNQTAACFVKAEGFNLLYRDLVDLFPGRVKDRVEPFPLEIRRKLRKTDPGRVI